MLHVIMLDFHVHIFKHKKCINSVIIFKKSFYFFFKKFSSAAKDAIWKVRRITDMLLFFLQKMHTADEVQKDMAAFIFKQPGKNNLTLLSQGKWLLLIQYLLLRVNSAHLIRYNFCRKNFHRYTLVVLYFWCFEDVWF